jgi:hypothetical protein
VAEGSGGEALAAPKMVDLFPWSSKQSPSFTFNHQDHKHFFIFFSCLVVTSL